MKRCGDLFLEGGVERETKVDCRSDWRRDRVDWGRLEHTAISGRELPHVSQLSSFAGLSA